MRAKLLPWMIASCLLVGSSTKGEDKAVTFAAPAVTRPELKQILEKQKQAKAHLPLPETRPQDAKGPGSGKRTVNNGLYRRTYLPASWYSNDFKTDPSMPLDYKFKVQMFWVVARAHNCLYCLGHQEHKLSAAGMADDEIAALDCNWEAFPEPVQHALALSRKMTLYPHQLTDEDFRALRKSYNDAQLVDMIYTIAFYNSVTRWTGGLNLPQDPQFALEGPVSEKYQSLSTKVAATSAVERPALEKRAEVVARWETIKKRQPRVAVPSVEQTRANLPEGFPVAAESMANWQRMMAQFPKTGTAQIQSMDAVLNEGDLPKRLKAEIFWTTARNNRAWYASAHAARRLEKEGMSADAIFSLDDPSRLPDAERSALQFARKLTLSLQTVNEGDFAELRKHFTNAQVAQIVYTVCAANMFDRFTEALALPLEEK